MKHLVESIGQSNFRKQNTVRLRKPDTLFEFSSFKSLKEKYEKQGLYELNEDLLRLSLLKTLGPEKYYSNNSPI